MDPDELHKELGFLKGTKSSVNHRQRVLILNQSHGQRDPSFLIKKNPAPMGEEGGPISPAASESASWLSLQVWKGCIGDWKVAAHREASRGGSLHAEHLH